MRVTAQKLGCGSADHEANCLCDVNLDGHPATERMVAPDGKLVDAAIRALDRSNPGRWNTLDLLKAIAVVTEAFHARSRNGGDGDSRARVLRGVETHLSLGYSMTETCDFFARPLSEIVFTISNGNPNKTWAWTLDEWDEFIDDIRHMPHNGLNLSRLARKWGVTDRLTARWAAAVNPLYQPIIGNQNRRDQAS